MAMTYEKEKRLKAKADKLDTRSGFRKWLDSWRWSSIKKTWNSEYSRVTWNYKSNMQRISNKLK